MLGFAVSIACVSLVTALFYDALPYVSLPSERWTGAHALTLLGFMFAPLPLDNPRFLLWLSEEIQKYKGPGQVVFKRLVGIALYFGFSYVVSYWKGGPGEVMSMSMWTSIVVVSRVCLRHDDLGVSLGFTIESVRRLAYAWAALVSTGGNKTTYGFADYLIKLFPYLLCVVVGLGSLYPEPDFHPDLVQKAAEKATRSQHGAGYSYSEGQALSRDRDTYKLLSSSV